MVGAQIKNSRIPRIPGIRSWLVLSACVTLPVLVALGGAYLLGSEAFHSRDLQAQQNKMEEVRSQSRLLLENVWDQIDSLKVKAVDYTRNREAMDPEIKAFGEIVFNPNGTGHELKNLTRNSSWTNAPGNFGELAEVAVRQISTKEIHQAGVAMVPIPRAEGQGTQQVAFAFQVGTQFIFVAADPTEVFGRFTRWTTRREAGNLRGYLISSKGNVLVHSERVYSGADFSGSDVFTGALRPLFRGERESGVATFRAVDLRTVTAAYAGMGSFPYAVVVERVVHPSGIGFLRQILIPLMLLLAACLLICLFSILAIQKYFDRARAATDAAVAQFAMSSASRAAQSAELTQLKNRLSEKLGTPEVGEIPAGSEKLIETDPGN